MIKITRLDLKNLERISAGTYGTVYRVDKDTVYKIYNWKTVDYYSGISSYNPIFLYPKRRFKNLIEKSKEIEYSSGAQDLVYVDGHFGGISMRAFNGQMAFTKLKDPIREKFELSDKMVRNSIELDKHYIYPMDYKLNNMIVTSDGELYFIDIDDTLTHICSRQRPRYRERSIDSLAQTIEAFYRESDHLLVPQECRKELKRHSHEFTPSYSRIQLYLDAKKQEKDVLFIDGSSNFEKVAELCANHNFTVVYVLDNNDEKEMRYIIAKCKIYGIELFDFVTKSQIEQYPQIETVNSSHILENKELKLIKER